MAQSGASPPAPPPVIARAHHGSVSKEQRALIEDDLKRGRLPCVVATSSLELGIDMGAVDLVVQVESPPSVASGLQRVGRAGHQVGEVSRGVLFPKHRGDLVQTAVAVERMRAGQIESMRDPAQPARRARPAGRGDGRDGRLAGRRRSSTWSAAPRRFAQLPRGAFDAILDLLAGRYPSDEFAELRPRIVWDRVTGAAHRPARRPAARGHQRRHHPRPRPVRRLPGRRRGARAAGRRARRGDGLRVAGRRRLRARRHQLADRGHHPRPGAGHARTRRTRAAAVLEGRRPRPAGRARRGDRRVRPRARRVAARAAPTAAPRQPGSTRGPPATWSATSTSSARPPACCPTTARSWSSGSATSSATGGWSSTPRSARPVHAPWALAITARLRERYGVDGQAMPPTTASCSASPTPTPSRPAASVIAFDPDEIEDLVTPEVGGSALFAVAVPRVRRPRAAAAPPRPRPALARCGSSASARRAARGRRPSTPRSRSCSRRCASACRTSTTCRRWSA